MTTVWVTFQQEGWHRWPEAPQEVAYLAQRHRHIFHFRVELQVEHTEREVELHQLKAWCISGLFNDYDTSENSVHGLEFGDFSCERIAQLFAEAVREHYPYSWVAVEVSEDGECGARVELRPLRHKDEDYQDPSNPDDEVNF